MMNDKELNEALAETDLVVAARKAGVTCLVQHNSDPTIRADVMVYEMALTDNAPLDVASRDRLAGKVEQVIKNAFGYLAKAVTVLEGIKDYQLGRRATSRPRFACFTRTNSTSCDAR